MSRVAVIGAGLAGLHVARTLGNAHDVRVFEKSRGPGGRMATRRADGWNFDHGAQFFTARTAAFKKFLEPLLAANVVEHWPARFAEICDTTVTAERRWTEDYPHYVGWPTMNAIGKHLAQGVDIATGFRIEGLERTPSGWMLRSHGQAAQGPFDWAIVTAPAAQTADLLPTASPLSRVAAAAPMKSCFALMLGFETLPDVVFDAALVRRRDISWISLNSSKPGRSGKPSIVVHATNAWADRNLERDIETVRDHLLAELAAVTGIDGSGASHIDVQRWRYANIDKQTARPGQIDDTLRLGVCGDWLIRGRIESAFTSAERLLAGLDGKL